MGIASSSSPQASGLMNVMECSDYSTLFFAFFNTNDRIKAGMTE
jgi:hypothetical protein